MTMLCTVMAFAGNVSNLDELQAALAAGGEITLTDNINAGTTQLNITKATTIDGQGQYAIISSANPALLISSAVEVNLNDLTLYAKSTATGASAIKSTAAVILTLNNTTINAKARGINHLPTGQALLTLTLNNSCVQAVKGCTVDAQGNPQNVNYEEYVMTGDDARGLNVCRSQNGVITLNNSLFQGFSYNVNFANTDCTGLQLRAYNSIFKGRCAYNVWNYGMDLLFQDCSVVGINKWAGTSESFACFVFNTGSHDNTLTIKGGSFASAVFPAAGANNEYARQFFLTHRGVSNSIEVYNAQYACPKNLGNNKGGVVEYMYPNGGNNYIEINDGIYNCPEIMEMNYTTSNHLVINGGTYNLNRICGETLDAYPMIKFQTIHLTGGTYTTDMSETYEYNTNPGEEDNEVITFSMIADGYKQVRNANDTYSIVPEATEAQSTAVNDVNWNTAADWSTTSQAEETVPDAATSVTIGNGTEDVSVVVANDGAADVYRVDLNDKVTLTVQDGGVLTVGDGGIVAHENAEVVVEEGGSLVLNGLIQGTENIVIEASEENSAVVLIAPDVNTYGDEHPVGTFRFTSKSYKNGSKVVHQRFGMPTYNTGIDVKYGTTSSAKTYITNWDYEADDWKHSGDVVEWTEIPSSGSLPLVTAGPFACYDLISNNAKGDEITYEFTGALMGNADGEMKFNRGFNPYANSYTAPIDIESFLNRIASEYAGTDIKPTIYLYKAQANDNYTWASIGQDEFEFGDAEFTEVAPMQAFMLYLGSSTPQIATIDYEGNVYDPFIAKLSSSPSNAPARRVATKKNYLSMTITDAEGVEYDRVKFIEDDRFSSAFDNGYDAVKFMKEDVAIYAAADEAQATVASDYVEGMNIGVKVAKSGVYTLTVKYNGLDYALIDTENNTIIELENGKTYNFFAEAGQNDARFQVIKVNKVPTAIDEVEDSQVMSTKFMKDGVLYIIKNGAVYNAQGQIVK